MAICANRIRPESGAEQASAPPRPAFQPCTRLPSHFLDPDPEFVPRACCEWTSKKSGHGGESTGRRPNLKKLEAHSSRAISSPLQLLSRSPGTLPHPRFRLIRLHVRWPEGIPTVPDLVLHIRLQGWLKSVCSLHRSRFGRFHGPNEIAYVRGVEPNFSADA